MRPFFAIATNAFMELVRQPVFLLLASASGAFIVILAALPYFGLGDDPKMVKDSVLAMVFLAGLFGAVIGASASLAHELRRGTALAVLAKPVGRARFLLAKFSGVAAALTLLTFLNAVAALIAGRMAYDAYGEADLRSLGFFLGAWALAYGLGGFSNYFLRRPFASDTVLLAALLVTVAAAVIFQAGPVVDRSGEMRDVDWRMVPAAVLILFALWVLAAVALACATRLDLIPTLAVCVTVFLLGLMSDYLFGRPAAEGAGWATVLYTVLPNWQLFWLADALEEGRQIPWAYVGRSTGYVAAWLTAVLAMALLWFDDRELN
jgi:ABC-type transport system involved in multi-copper enzyme maturation permease subunit